MATTIKLKNSVTTTNAPSSLAQGEVAINITDKKVWVGNAATTPVQLLGDGGSASFTSIAFGAGTVSNPSITFTGDTNTGIYSPAADTIAFTEGGVESMRIDSSGNVGIGTSSPTASRLHIAGYNGGTTYPIRMTSSNSGVEWTFETGGSAANSSFLAFRDMGNSAERMRIDSSGNVGIGTSSPDQRLDVRGSGGISVKAQSSNSSAQLILNSSGTNVSYINYGQTGANPLAFYDSNAATERMRIDSSGNVGIGTTSPATRLDVQSATCIPKFTSTTGTNAVYTQMVNTGGNFYTGIDNSTGASSGVAYGRFVYGDGAYPMLFFTNSTERMRILSGGQIGIGVTPNTANRLEVKGADSTSGSQSLYCTNSNGTDQLFLRNDNYFNSGAIANYSVAGTALVIDAGNYVGKTTSSLRYKKDIVDYDKGLDAIAKLRPVYYKSAVEGPNGIDPKQHAGFIAEEIDAEGFEEFLIRNQEGEPDAIQYAQMTALLCKAIQEQQAMIEELKQEVDKLKGV